MIFFKKKKILALHYAIQQQKKDLIKVKIL